MRARAAFWWYGRGRLLPLLLTPVSLIWRTAGALRTRLTRPYRSRLPVICVGNPTAGGGGKTPAAIAIAELLKGLGERPVFLSRGHGGSFAGPHLVDPAKDSAARVGDEPLLLARTAPVIVSVRRDKGARFAETLNASVIVMDDGFQNPGLAKDFSLLALDRAVGVGNGRVIPAGPLRAPLKGQLRAAQAVLLTGESGRGDEVARQAQALGLAVIEARLSPTAEAPKLGAKRVVAFAGIARPQKFFDSLAAAGARIVAAFPFPDHHAFSGAEARELLSAARTHGAILVTTEKDFVRITDEELRQAAQVLPVELMFRHKQAVIRLLRDAMMKSRNGRRS